MPFFDFSLSKKKDIKRKTSKNNSRSKVILKGVKGVIWIDNNAEYNVTVNMNGVLFKYPIHNSCYSCKGHARVYRRGVAFKDRYVYIRSLDKYTECNPFHYLPFAPGCIVVGDLVKSPIDDNNLFIIKNCWTELDNTESHEAIAYYKEHMDEINNIIKQKLME